MSAIQLASAGDDIKLWDSSSYILLKQFNPYDQDVKALAWSHDNSFLASSSSKSEKIIVSYVKNTAVTCMELEANSPQICVDFTSNTRYLASGGTDRSVSIWDVKSQKIRKTFVDHKSSVTTVQFNRNDSYIATGSASGEIILYNIVTGQGSSPLIAPRSQNSVVQQLQYSYTKKSLLAAVHDNGQVNLWDTNTRRMIQSFTDTHKAPVMGVAFSPINEMLMITAGLDKRINCYDVSTNKFMTTIMAEGALTSLSLMPDGATFVVGTMRGHVIFYDLRNTGSPLKVLNAHKSSVQCLKFQYNIQSTSKSSSAISVSNFSGSHRPPTKAISSHNAKAVAPPIPLQPADRLNIAEAPADVFSPLNEGHRSNSSIKEVSWPDQSSRLCTENRFQGGVFSPLTANVSSSTSYSQSMIDGGRDTMDRTNASDNPVKLPRESTEYGSGLYGISEDSYIQHRTNGHSVRSQDGASSLVTQESKGDKYGASVAQHFDFNKDQLEYKSSSFRPQSVHGQGDYDIPEKDVSTSASAAVSQKDNSRLVPELPPPSGISASPSLSSLQTKLDHTRTQSVVSNVLHADKLIAEGAEHPTDQEEGAHSAILQPFQVQFMKSLIHEEMEEFTAASKQQMYHLQWLMIKQFYGLETRMASMMEYYSLNKDLVAENEMLREEIKKLKKIY